MAVVPWRAKGRGKSLSPAAFTSPTREAAIQCNIEPSPFVPRNLTLQFIFVVTGALRGCPALQDMPQFAGFTARTLARIATDLGLQLDDVDELVGLAAQLIGNHRGVVLRWWKPR